MTREAGNSPARLWLARARFVAGYILFGGVLIYAFRRAPEEVWRLAPGWLALALGVIVLMMLMQWAQVTLFLRAHGVRPGWYWPLMFTLKKGILNTVLPAKSGTLVLVHLLTQRYPVRWHDYLQFSMTAGVASLIISALALAWLIFSPAVFVPVLLATLAVCYVASRKISAIYMTHLPMLLLNGLGQYACVLLTFWSILCGMGYFIGIRDASYFGVALNTLAQFTITPGNVGVRESVMGMLAPYLAMPVAVGIIAGGVFYVLRTTVFGAMLAALTWGGRISPFLRRAAASNPNQRSN